MSEFTPLPQNKSASAPADVPAVGTLKSAKQPDARTLGWSLSIGLHVLACSLLLTGISSGLRLNKMLGPASSGAAAADPESAQARQQVQQILQTQQELERIQARTETEYTRWLRTQASHAVANTQQAIQIASEAHAQAARALLQADDAQRAVEQARQALAQATNSGERTRSLNALQQAQDAFAKAQDVVQRAQEQAGEAYAEASRNLAFAPEGSGDTQAVRQAIDATVAARTQARDAQSRAASALSTLRTQENGLAETVRAMADGPNQTANAQNAQAAQAATAKALQTATQQQNDLQQKLKTGDQAAQQLAQAQRDATQAQLQAQQQHTAAATAARQLRATTPEPASETATAPPGARMHERQGAHEEGSAGAPGSALDAQHRNSFQNLNSQDLAQLYDTATRAEAANLITAQQIQARAASMAQTIPLQQALDATDATPPVRPPLGNQGHPGIALFSSASGMTSRQREEARQQIAAMTALAQQMLNRAQPAGKAVETSPPKGSARGTPVATATMRTSAAPSARQIALAAEEDGRPAKDMTGTAFSPPGLPDQESIKTPKANLSGKLQMPPGANMGGEAPPPSPPVEIKALPGRIVGTDVSGRGPGGKEGGGEKSKGGGAATGTDWMYVDSWYTIGPFPNPQRQNIHKPFPPEAGVDLDAVYVGKDNRTVRWQWVQTGKPELVPNIPEEYAIYYGYTELWFEEPADLWIALGSDDKSTLWIEDQLVWVSSDILKGWRIDEGLRKVHFKKGLNRVLFRLENGWRGVGFSLCVCLKPR